MTSVVTLYAIEEERAALLDTMAVPVMRWIGRRIAHVEELL